MEGKWAPHRLQGRGSKPGAKRDVPKSQETKAALQHVAEQTPAPAVPFVFILLLRTHRPSSFLWRILNPFRIFRKEKKRKKKKDGENKMTSSRPSEKQSVSILIFQSAFLQRCASCPVILFYSFAAAALGWSSKALVVRVLSLSL